MLVVQFQKRSGEGVNTYVLIVLLESINMILLRYASIMLA